MNEKRKITDLTESELLELLDTNSHLQAVNYEAACDIVNVELEEITNCFKHNNRFSFSIHDHYYSFYITVDSWNYTDFITDLSEAQKDFCILDTEETAILNRLCDKCDFYDDLNGGYIETSVKKESCFIKWYESGVEKLRAALENYLHGIEEQTNDSDYLKELFLNDIDNGVYDDYITDGKKVYCTVCKA